MIVLEVPVPQFSILRHGGTAKTKIKIQFFTILRNNALL